MYSTTAQNRFVNTRVSIYILPKCIYDCHHIGELQPFLVELCLVDGSMRKPHDIIEDVIIIIEYYFFPVDSLVVDIQITMTL